MITRLRYARLQQERSAGEAKERRFEVIENEWSVRSARQRQDGGVGVKARFGRGVVRIRAIACRPAPEILLVEGVRERWSVSEQR